MLAPAKMMEVLRTPGDDIAGAPAFRTARDSRQTSARLDLT